MISERLEAARKQLAATGNCRVYTVQRISSTEVLALVVPKGSEHLDTCNLDGGLPPDDACGDWGQLAAPYLVSLDESVLPPQPKPPPNLTIA